MIALADNIVAFKIPKKPRVKEKEPLPDQRKFAVLPLRALKDKALTDIQIRVLGLICSYTNRAGITFVGTQQLANDLQVSRQAISKQLVKLKAAGYVEVVKKGFRGERTDTIRVIFDPSIDTETAIAITSTIEDTRTPDMIREQQKQQDNSIDHEGLKRIQDMIQGVVKPMSKPPKEYTMPKGKDTVTVAKMKAEIAAKKARKDKHIVNQEVVNVEAPIVNHIDNQMDNQEVVTNIEERMFNDYVKVLSKELKVNFRNVEVLKILVGTIAIAELETLCKELTNRYQAEGIAIPTSEALLANDLMTLSAENLLRTHGV